MARTSASLVHVVECPCGREICVVASADSTVLVSRSIGAVLAMMAVFVANLESAVNIIELMRSKLAHSVVAISRLIVEAMSVLIQRQSSFGCPPDTSRWCVGDSYTSGTDAGAHRVTLVIVVHKSIVVMNTVSGVLLNNIIVEWKERKAIE